MSWNEERVDLLSKMWLEGRSASQIAVELGQGVTRNAVIGKVHRLGLSGRVKVTPPPARLRGKADAAPDDPLEVATAPVVAEATTPVVVAVRTTDVVIPFSSRVTIMELRDTMCRWPLGDPTSTEFRYCGSRSGGVGPYCGDHARLAFQPTQERRRVDRVARIA